MRYFAVTCKHGHHGAKQFCPITFGICAKDAIDACEHAKSMPGVKHDQSVIGCREISYETYQILRKESAYERAGVK